MYKAVIITRDLIDKTNERRAQLFSLFGDENFELFKILDDFPTMEEAKDAIDLVKTSLNDTDLILFVDEKTTSSETKEFLETLYDELRTKLLDNVDIFYLANYLDTCQRVVDIDISADNYRFYRAYYPNGMFCVVSTKEKWTNILTLMEGGTGSATARLSHIVEKGQIIAGTVWPRIFVPNISMLSTNLDNLFTQPCRLEEEYGLLDTNNKETAFYWFIVGMITIVFVIWYSTRTSNF